MSLGLVTDLYEPTIAASHLRRGMTEPATFSLFVWRLPPAPWPPAAGPPWSFPDRTGFPVDTCDTERGVETVLDFADEMNLSGGLGVPDLLVTSPRCRPGAPLPRPGEGATPP